MDLAGLVSCSPGPSGCGVGHGLGRLLGVPLQHPEVVSRRQIAWAEAEVACPSFWARGVAGPMRTEWAIAMWRASVVTAA